MYQDDIAYDISSSAAPGDPSSLLDLGDDIRLTLISNERAKNMFVLQNAFPRALRILENHTKKLVFRSEVLLAYVTSSQFHVPILLT